LKNNRIVAYLVIVFGAAFVVTGIAFAAMYLLEAVVATAGEPDRSVIFWYLPVLFAGLIGIGAGFGMFVWGIRRLKSTSNQE